MKFDKNKNKNIIVKQENKSQRENRLIKVLKLGTITFKDYDLPEMPSPTMVSIEGKRFDFKGSIRNADYRSCKQYESLELLKICPNLYFKKLKVSSSPSL